MVPRSAPLLRWLRAALAVLALLGSDGLHEALHSGSGPAPVTAQPCGEGLEIHAGDCQHRQDLHEPHGHGCIVCKGGRAHELLLVAACAACVAADTHEQVATGGTAAAPRACLPGTLGARGPPVTTV
jgi:hypothetical protein